MVDRVDYEEGSDFAYIRFVDQNAAVDACRAMKGFPLGGRDRCIIADFAKFAFYICTIVPFCITSKLSQLFCFPEMTKKKIAKDGAAFQASFLISEGALALHQIALRGRHRVVKLIPLMNWNEGLHPLGRVSLFSKKLSMLSRSSAFGGLNI